MSDTVVDRLYNEFKSLNIELGETEISLRSTAEEVFTKSLLLAAASYFERKITKEITRITTNLTGGNVLITELIRTKAIERQYHTYFDWSGNNANSFFGLFGEAFKRHMKEFVAKNTDYRDSIVAFLQLGNDRNRLVHQDFGTFSLDKTAEEIYLQFNRARIFAESLNERFDVFCASIADVPGEPSLGFRL